MRVALLLAVLVALVPHAASAEVTDKGAIGFTVKRVVTIAAAPDVVYAAVVEHLGDWWSKDHTYSGDPKNLSVVAEAGGCFCEKWADGAAQHMTVVNVSPGKLLRLTGALGPLQQLGVTGALTLVFDKNGNAATRLTLTYTVGGYMDGGLDKLAGPVDSVLGDQVGRLKDYVEKGRP